MLKTWLFILLSQLRQTYQRYICEKYEHIDHVHPTLYLAMLRNGYVNNCRLAYVLNLDMTFGDVDAILS